MENTEDKAINIDIDAVLRQRAPGIRRLMPRILVRSLEKLICQDGLNYLLHHNHGRRDADFCAGILSDLNVEVDVAGHIPETSRKRVLLVCNHPLGALDGIAIIHVLTGIYGCKIRFIVNALLMAVEPLRGVFVPINKHGRQSRGATNAIDEAMAGNEPVVIFPAGLCSRQGPAGEICDLEWKKMFVTKAIRYNRDVIPMHFDGRNSRFFYKFAKWRKRLGLKFNLEMILLPREIFRNRNKRFTLTFGKPIPFGSLTESPAKMAAMIKQTVYNLPAAIASQTKQNTIHHA